jgi:hypothetical protein
VLVEDCLSAGLRKFLELLELFEATTEWIEF